MPRRTRAESEATAAAILAAARGLYAERGYAAVAVEEVAAACGVTRGAVYHHYGSRAGLFAAVHADVTAAVGAEIERATDGLGDLWESLEAGCRAFLSAVVADDARQVVLVDGPAVLGWARWREDDAASSGRLLDEVLGELADAGRVRAADVPATSALLSGAMNEAALWVAASPDRDRALDQAWAVLRRLLRGIEA
ncbi:TetR/AcrR family transcriptional regulator [Isoptericola nanjingensis]|uniref:TetR/AcrR family transcriptional regulator n=1 Tax=Isoptericola TaxID=254250 RepID=UPI0035F0197E|nr:TetR/AcrR family transcriptional regulator [Isoptericola sp. QY 916]